ncbi:MAG: Isoleucyl-tRNA synthetase, partial [Evtepia sp.]|nr:Isoleucyl-tRNA synthetase [Evtepia sp.]
LFDLDRFALHSFNELVKFARESYEVYDFHAVYRAIYNYCVVDLSNFYFDIIKDRLYCDDEAARSAAQTTLYRILNGLTLILTPILAFTSEEIWASMPHDKEVFSDSVLLNEIPTYEAGLVLPEAELTRWNRLVSLRDAVNKALENNRSQGGVKKNQDAELSIFVKKEEDAKMLESVDLATLFIVSKVTILQGDGEGELMEGAAIPATISVKESQAPKCPRCWNHHDEISGEGLCPRCARVVSFLS